MGIWNGLCVFVKNCLYNMIVIYCLVYRLKLGVKDVIKWVYYKIYDRVMIMFILF